MIPLRLHSEYSLLRAMVPVKKYARALKAAGYAGGAITDFNCGFGWVDFFFSMKEEGMTPILGTCLEISLLDGGKNKGEVSILVLNQTGYENLCQILSAYSFKTLRLKYLLEKSDGLLLLVSPSHPDLEKAESFFKQWPKENLLFEVHRHEGAKGEEVSVAMAAKLGVKNVATQPTLFLSKEDHLAHEVLMSIGTQTRLDDENRPQLPSDDFNLKTKEEFEARFHDHPEWLSASDEVYARVDFDFQTDTYHFPSFGENSSLDARFEEACLKGLEKRFDLVRVFTPEEEWEETEKAYRARLKEEVEIIQNMKFPGYFMIVADFIQWSKDNGVPVGPGRGSGAGSIAAYSLGITDIDPIRYGLLFERFLNPERVSMPDFDVDFCIKGRDRVIQYCREKYNLNHEAPIEDRLRVSQIITFGKMKSKAVIRDVGRVLGVPYGDVDAIAKLIPNVLNITLQEAYEMEPEFEALRHRDPLIDRLLRIAERLEGLSRHSSVHAAGVVIADQALTKYIPLYQGSDEEIVCQFEMKGAEKIGLVKFDFLGLRNLTVVKDCIEITGEEIDLLKIDYDDQKLLGEVCSGDTVGLFQLESSGMRDLISKLRPASFEDVAVLVALYRPGPLEGGMVDDFIQRKAGKKAITYAVPALEEVLKETYGVFVYQEQVMKTASVMAGFSLGDADLLRRAMGKKIASEMAKQREKFVKGAVKNNYNEHVAQDIFDLMSEFAKYGFNKSHAAAYGMIACQTAYLKHYYPEAFYAALLSSEGDDTEKLGTIAKSAVFKGVQVLPPHVNFSEPRFCLEVDQNGAKQVRFGLNAIKNLGQNVANAVFNERKKNGLYKNYEDFFLRIPAQLLNKRQVEVLIRSGALDEMGSNRASLFHSIEKLVGAAQSQGRDRLSGQVALFAAKPEVKEVEDWPDRIRLNDEKHLLGIYMSGHPLQAYYPILQSLKTVSIQKLKDRPAPPKDREVPVGGLIVSSKEIFTKKGTKMAFVNLEDLDSNCEVVVFPDLFEKKGNLLIKGRPILVRGQVVKESDVTKILARDISDLAQTEIKEIIIRLESKEGVSSLAELAARAKKTPGDVPLKVEIPMEGEVKGHRLNKTHVTMETPFKIQPTPAMINWMQSQFGRDSLHFR